MAQELPGATSNAGASHTFSLSFPYMHTPGRIAQDLPEVSQSHCFTTGGFTGRQHAYPGLTRPVTIPGFSHTHANQAPPHEKFCTILPWSPGDAYNRRGAIIDPCSVLSPEVIDDEQVLGSWADRKITYGFEPPPVPAPLSPVAEKTTTYGFIPPDLQLKKPSASAFWPEARDGAIAPCEAAAAFAQAARPSQRVAFNAACRVVAPDPPRAAKGDAPALRLPHKPAWQARRSDNHLPVEERLWRIRAKRAWIREQLQALRGYPDAAADADYAEPWSDALALVEGMGGGTAIASVPEAPVLGSNSPDAMGDDSALHDSVMFGEDAPSARPDPVLRPDSKTTVVCPAANGKKDMQEETPESMENVMPGMHVKEFPPAVRDQQAFLKPAAPDAMQPARIVQGFAPGNGSQGIVRRAQELMNYQRSIEAAMHKGWQSRFVDPQTLANPDSRLKGRRTTHPEMLREDSAYEMYPGYRNAIKGGLATAVKVPAEQEKAVWAGALVPAFEIDEAEAGDMIVVVVRLIDKRTGRSRVVHRGKADISGSAILSALDDQLAQVAQAHNFIKPTMQLVRAGRMQWSREA